MKSVKIYNLKQIEGACIIGSPVVAGILIAHNYRKFGEYRKSMSWIFIGILWTIGLLTLGFLLPENISNSAGMVIPFLNGAILYPILKRIQGEKIREHFENNGEKGSNWRVFGLTIAFAAAIIIPIILLSRNSPVSDLARRDINGSGIYHNTKMPIEEVEKLGGILTRIEYFDPSSPGEVLFVFSDTTYELTLLTEKALFNDESFIQAIKVIFNHIEKYNFAYPLNFKITDPYFTDEKVILLKDSDILAPLLEVDAFESNPNFTIVYDIAIESRERVKFQEIILDLETMFPHNNDILFMVEFDNENYLVTLLAPSQAWSNPQLIGQAKFFKQKLNEASFSFPFRLYLTDNTTAEVKSMEID